MYGRGNSGWTISMRNEEFEEDDVWAVFKERNDIDSISKVSNEKSSTISPRPLPSAARMIPRPGNINSSALEPKIVQQSAPVNVPDWTKIYGKKHFKTTSNSKNSAWLDHDHDDGNGYYDDGDDDDDDDDDDDADDGDTMMPPHEWIAKKLARNQISSFSVCEGAGRTLKGRDLSRVRNAVLSRTGFLEG